MTDVDVDVQDETGSYRVTLGGGLFGQAASFASRVRQAIDDGRATGKYESSWLDATVTGDVLLDLLNGLGDVPAYPLRGVKAVRRADLIKGIVRDRHYAVSAVEN